MASDKSAFSFSYPPFIQKQRRLCSEDFQPPSPLVDKIYNYGVRGIATAQGLGGKHKEGVPEK